MEVFNATKESIQEMQRSHHSELESAAQARADEVTSLKATHAKDLETLTQAKEALARELSDREGELATVEAELAAATESGAPAASEPAKRANGSTASEDNIQKLHDAHNLRIGDLEAKHTRTLKALEAELEAEKARASELEADVERKKLELSYLEQDYEEKDDNITRYVNLRVLRFMRTWRRVLATLFCLI